MNGSTHHKRFLPWAGRVRLVQWVIILFLLRVTTSAQGFGTNLLQNGGNDLPLVSGEIPGWVEVQGTSWTQRSANPPPHSGSSYFYPGAAGVAELRQDVNVTQFSAELDARGVVFEFRGFTRGFSGHSDQSRIMVEYCDVTGTNVLATFDTGNRTQTAVWEEARDVRTPPPGTRLVRVRLISTRSEGSNNDGYYDSLSLVALACAAPPVSVAAWWQAESNTIDAQGRHDGTLRGDTGYTNGLAGQAFRFDGNGDYIEVPHSPDLSFEASAPMSAECWVYRTSSAAVMHFLGKRSGCGTMNYQMALNTGSGEGLVFGGDNGGAATGVDLPMEQWTHLVGTFDGNTFRVYIDGELRATSPGPGSLGPTNSAPFTIGTSGGCASFGGLMDEVAIYNRALPIEEIRALHAASGAGRCLIFPRISNLEVPGALAGKAYSSMLSAQEGVPPYRFSILSGALPPGITLNTNGLLSGVPSSPGNFNFTVLVTDALNRTGQRSFTMQVLQCASTPSGLIHVYAGETNVNDSVGTLHGTPQNGTAFTSGKVGNAFTFDGINDYVDLGNWFDLQVFSIAMWVKARPSQQTYADIIDNNHTDGRSWVIQYNNSGLSFQWGVAQRGSISFNLTADTWQHLVVSYDSNFVGRLFLDGVLVGSYQGNGPVPYDGSQYLRLSGWVGGGRHFNGQIDDVAIYNRAITASEVQILYAADSAGRCETVNTGSDLAIASVVAPTNTAAGQPITVSFVLTNGGSNAASGLWTNAVVVSSNAGTPLIAIGRIVFNGSLTAGATTSVTQSIILPAGVVGEYSLGVVADWANQIGELNETNNLTFAPQPLRIRAADLVVEVAGAPAFAQRGSSIQVNWRVRNNGDAEGAASWSDAVYLATNATSLTGSILLGTRPAADVIPLAIGASYVRTQSVTLPLALTTPPGNYFIVVRTDSSQTQIESSESNNQNSLPIAVTQPALPDLLVTNVISSHIALPGESVTVRWTVTNGGAATLGGAWTEAILLRNDEAAQPDQLLQTFTVSNILAPGEFLSRTQIVMLPLTNTAGLWRVMVAADVDNRLLEQNENNNDSLATNTLTVPAALRFAAPVSRVSESASNVPIRCVITRNAGLESNLIVTLSASLSNELMFPPQVTIPMGQSSVMFDIFSRGDGVADGDRYVRLAASAGNYFGAEVNLTVIDVDLPRLRLEIVPGSIAEGQTAAATLTREPLTTNDLNVLLVNSSRGRLAAPGSIVITASQASVTFTVAAVENGTFEAAHVASVTATVPGFVESSDFLTITDNDAPLLVLALASDSVSESAGGVATVATVTRNSPSGEPLTLGLSSSAPNAAVVPPTVTILPNETTTSFPIGVVNDASVDGTQMATLTATAINPANGELLGISAESVLSVLDDDGPSLTLTLDRTVAAEGLTGAATGTVTRNTSTTSNLLVMLGSSDTSEATVPDSVNIPAGAAAATFGIATVNDAVSDGNQNVSISATAPGFAVGAARLVVSDINVPDLVITGISSPSNALNDATVQVTFTIANQGVAAFNGTTIQRVLLSRDRFVGDDTVLGNFEFTGALNVGNSTSRMVPIRVPVEPGDYWIVAVADATGLATEGLEDNNTAITVLPLRIAAAYTAFVETPTTVSPAGTPVPLTGQATLAGGGAAANVPVNIYIDVRGTRRTLTATTDANGYFTSTFYPLGDEAGHYDVAAANPGVTDVAPQDSFTLLGMRAEPQRPSHRMSALTTISNTIDLVNLSDVPISGINAALVGSSGGVAVQLVTPAMLNGGATNPLFYSIQSAADIGLAGTLVIRVTSAEGVTIDVPIDLVVSARQPRLTLTPGALSGGVVRGQQTLIEFEIRNDGGTASGPIQVNLPEVPWMHAASELPLPSLNPGESNRVTLQLMPALDAPLIQQNGSLVISSPGAQSVLPFSFNILSTALGDFHVVVEDEYTFYAAGSPRLSNATVIVSDALTAEVVTNGVTGAGGEVFFGALREGYYNVAVSADKHSAYRKTVLVNAGRTNDLKAFLSRQTVQYIWTVVPTEIEDRTRIHIETVFETVVPIPVVTVEPSLIDLAEIQGDIEQIDLKISNHGLIAANAAKLTFGSHPNYQIQPLVNDLDRIPAQGTLTVPLLIRKLSAGAAVAGKSAKNGGGAPCTIGGGVSWTLICGDKTNNYTSPVSAINAGVCALSSGGSPVTFDSVPQDPPAPSYQELKPAGPMPDGGAVAFSGGMISISSPVSCEPCDEENFEEEDIFSKDISALFKPVETALEAAITAQVGGLVTPDVKLKAAGGLRTCCEMGSQGYEVYGSAGAGLEISVGPAIEPKVSITVDLEGVGTAKVEGSLKMGIQATGGVGLSATVSSGCNFSGFELSATAEVDLGFFAGVTGEVKATAQSGPLEGESEPVSLDVSFQGHVKVSLKYEDGSLTTHVCSDGIYYAARGSAFGRSFNLFETEKVYLVDEYCPKADVTTKMSQEEARKVFEAFKKKYGQRTIYPSFAVTNSTPKGLTAPPRPSAWQNVDRTGAVKPSAAGQVAGTAIPKADEGICARVRLRLDQDLVMTRSAFNATLELINGDPLAGLENISVEVNAIDLSGQNANDKFGIRAPVLRGLNAVDGTGSLAPDGTGSASWILIPNTDAAPNGPTEYTVSGLLTYTQDGRQIVVPLLPVPITVFPDARLKIKYFHERDVFSDEPFTPLIEPALPYSLGVLVQNVGKGTAKNVKITSAQPQIVDNDKGLLIDFKIIGTQVGNQNVTPSLTVNMGHISSNGIAVGRWLFQSSLHGQFIDYQASFEHVDSLGDPRLSLVESVEIHEMIHAVNAGGSFHDGLPDFLVNDIPNGANLPDTLYLSDGRIMPVNVVLTATHDAPPSSNDLQVVLTSGASAGWRYLRVPDPGNGRFRLTHVVRSDGIEVPLDSNAWVTDRTFIENSRRPINEFNLHLFDYDSTGSYTLYYEVIPSGLDETAPVSNVTPLNAFSTRSFSVSWSGREELGGSGVASFDVFVSSNGGPFTLWLQNTHVTAGIFNGVPGSHYAFYSVATDASGNREAAPETPDAQTSVTGNTPPVFAPIGNITIDEGAAVNVVVRATDSDVPANALTYSLAPGAPQGMVLNPAYGNLTWNTGETHGPAAYPIRVYAHDDGVPSLLATQDLVVTVREVNSAPALPNIASTFTLTEGDLLSLDLRATDIDLPANPLQYSLVGAPAGASISGVGAFTWRPTEAQGGTTNVITVRVNDNGTPPLTNSRTFTVLVNDTNARPVLAGIQNYLIYEGSSLLLTARVTDVDIPANNIVFTLDAGHPAGMTIHPTSGVLSWTPGEAQIPTTNVLVVRATDNGVPPLDAATNFTVRTELLKFGLNLPKFLTPETFTFIFKGDTGRVYQVQGSPNLMVPTNWTPVFSFTATNRIVPLRDTNASPYPRRFYRAVQMN